MNHKWQWGVAEAIEMCITRAELVTVSVLDGRLMALEHRFKLEMEIFRTEFKTEIEKLRAEFGTALEKAQADLVRCVFLTMLGNVALSAGITHLLK